MTWLFNDTSHYILPKYKNCSIYDLEAYMRNKYILRKWAIDNPSLPIPSSQSPNFTRPMPSLSQSHSFSFSNNSSNSVVVDKFHSHSRDFNLANNAIFMPSSSSPSSPPLPSRSSPSTAPHLPYRSTSIHQLPSSHSSPAPPLPYRSTPVQQPDPPLVKSKSLLKKSINLLPKFSFKSSKSSSDASSPSSPNHSSDYYMPPSTIGPSSSAIHRPKSHFVYSTISRHSKSPFYSSDDVPPPLPVKDTTRFSSRWNQNISSSPKYPNIDFSANSNSIPRSSLESRLLRSNQEGLLVDI
ncbi:hypothetical protein AYI68_g3343 [Smittium mucronatum]|uniref:Uncharacterized protein n=1 Tax=Smittium mucronatum TaxID=133383 RepID=A0A1R0H068_9FUNG|nr:hypothetical protein AYI68_g3343 [Smittium mucronatum]